MAEPQATGSRRGIGLWGGIAIGVGATLLVLLVIVLISFLAMGRCPLCLRMMDAPMRDGMMRNGVMDEGMPADGDQSSFGRPRPTWHDARAS